MSTQQLKVCILVIKPILMQTSNIRIPADMIGMTDAALTLTGQVVFCMKSLLLFQVACDLVMAIKA
ncbi:MAG: hypothetical protein C0630_16495 [Sedimenticola selenatireducens]|uniref:Uncharacterized protein n=1 Tax=Sedimenticola selenatireducens TaxID=191960 RepID=A0A2N6CTE6_9GAMM|nr:MAG: hypothetical protein C0630_16495 [Sedimenticola selenatireducens]